MPLFEKCLERQTKTLGALHPDTITTAINMGNCNKDQGKFVIALPLFERALELQTQVGRDLLRQGRLFLVGM